MTHTTKKIFAKMLLMFAKNKKHAEYFPDISIFSYILMKLNLMQVNLQEVQ